MDVSRKTEAFEAYGLAKTLCFFNDPKLFGSLFFSRMKKKELVFMVMLPKMKALLLVGTALLLASCGTYRIVRNQTDKEATWAEYRTFAFVDTNRIEPTPRSNYQAAIGVLKRSVAAELVNRGYQPTSDNPDLLINVGAVINEKTQTRQTTIQEAPLYVGQRRYAWRSQEVPVGTYQEGTVSLHIVDAQRNALVWDVAVSSVLNRRDTGSGQGNINRVSSEQVSEAVARVFTRFPGRKL